MWNGNVIEDTFKCVKQSCAYKFVNFIKIQSTYLVEIEEVFFQLWLSIVTDKINFMTKFVEKFGCCEITDVDRTISLLLL